VDPSCCETTWDEACATLAVASCVISPANDRCDQARDLGLGRFPFTTVNADADGPPLATACVDEGTGGAFEGDVWFRHTALIDNGIFVSTCGHAGFDTRIAVYTGCGATLLTCSDDVAGCPDGTSRCAFYGVSGETYLIRVGGKFGTGEGEIDLAWGEVPEPTTEMAPGFTNGTNSNGHHYVVRTLLDGGSWTDAVETAARFGGYPATLDSPGENDFVVVRATPSEVGGPTTFGLLQAAEATDPAEDWGWVTGEEFYFSNWNAGEPNDAGRGEDFATIYRNGRWNDAAEGFGHVLIEFDDRPELEEAVWEPADGGAGERYRAVIEARPVTWSEARSMAQELGGDLVCLETEAEANFVFDRLAAFHSLWTRTNYNGGPWIGLELIKGSWRWTSGTSLDWDLWRPGEPNGSGDKGCFFSFRDGPRREIDDTFDRNVRYAFIVEFEPDPEVPCLGDLNEDGAITGADLGLLLGSWGSCPAPCSADLNGDGAVTGADIGLLLGGWGPCP
ncbi:MAG: lectin-like protein, partial [Planctomycetota bacterium]|nr:lectin-like protein [Planctomycetota bacterium]